MTKRSDEYTEQGRFGERLQLDAAADSDAVTDSCFVTATTFACQAAKK